jgi:hypothetical protein
MIERQNEPRFFCFRATEAGTLGGQNSQLPDPRACSAAPGCPEQESEPDGQREGGVGVLRD